MPLHGHPTPILRIFDEALARGFYVDFLEFEIGFEHRFAPDLPLYMEIVAGDCRLHLSEHHGDATPGARVRVPTTDLAAYAERLRGKAYKFARPGSPERAPWGDLELTLGDPFGNRLTFFEPGPPVT